LKWLGKIEHPSKRYLNLISWKKKMS